MLLGEGRSIDGVMLLRDGEVIGPEDLDGEREFARQQSTPMKAKL